MKYVQFSTNVSLLTEERVYRLYESGVDDIRCSIDGYTKQTYESIRLGLDYDVVKNNVLGFLRIRDELNWNDHVRLRMVDLEINSGEQEEWMAYWKNKVRKIDRVQIMPAEPWGNFSMSKREKYVTVMQHISCITVFSTIVIRPDGFVQLCCMDSFLQCNMGSILDSAIVDIWKSEKFKRIRNLHLERCRNEINICRGYITWNMIQGNINGKIENEK